MRKTAKRTIIRIVFLGLFIISAIIFFCRFVSFVGNCSEWADNGKREVNGKTLHYESSIDDYTTGLKTQNYVLYARGSYREMKSDEKQAFSEEHPEFWDDPDEFLASHSEYRYDFENEPEYPQIWREGRGPWLIGLSHLFIGIYGGWFKWRFMPAIQAAYQTSWLVVWFILTLAFFLIWRKLRTSPGKVRESGKTRSGSKKKKRKIFGGTREIRESRHNED